FAIDEHELANQVADTSTGTAPRAGRASISGKLVVVTRRPKRQISKCQYIMVADRLIPRYLQSIAVCMELIELGGQPRVDRVAGVDHEARRRPIEVGRQPELGVDGLDDRAVHDRR